MNNSVDYFNKNEVFDTDSFLEAVIPAKDDFEEGFKENFEEKFKDEFRNFQKDYNVPASQNFSISNQTLKSESKKLNNLIKLDTRIQIKLDFNNPEGCRDFLEKGYDESKGMSYYKVYFNEES